MESVDLATLERWFIRKGRQRAVRKSSPFEGGGSHQQQASSNRLQFHTRENRRQILDCLAKEVHEHSSSDTVLLRLTEAVREGQMEGLMCVCACVVYVCVSVCVLPLPPPHLAISADNCNVYMAELEVRGTVTMATNKCKNV